MSTLTPGALLARRYRLIDRVGAGGMSVIWRARDEVLDRTVAVKVLAASLAADARFRDLVRDEARAAAQLVHPHVATVHDYAETVAPDGTVTAFVVFELLTGEELEARLTEGPLPWLDAVRVCAEVAEALAAAHRLGIVHRDVTPANVMMTPTGAKVLDFGIATRVGAPDDDAEGETFGTPAYVAPERLDGTPAQPATDSYALGVLLYETLTGHVPVPADTWEELTRAWSTGLAPAPPDVPGLPPAVAELCMRCLARDPLSRPTAHAAAAELRAAIAPPAATPPPAPALGPAPAPRRGRLLVAAAVAAVLLLATAVLVPLLHEDPSSPDGDVVARPTATPSSVAEPPAPTPTAAGPVSFGEALSRVDGLITEGQQAGDIRQDIATDLRNLLRQLDAEETRPDRVNQLREKVAVRAGEGAISRPYAERLDVALAGFPSG
ncbi:serine/threonine-protein kinase [Asanoa sp. NPDC049518]|uniref:serine/threonine-protein kinase n=1 Tax=unclassified Asanoa TaxID=2685164 RepID=UPI00341E0924